MRWKCLAVTLVSSVILNSTVNGHPGQYFSIVPNKILNPTSETRIGILSSVIECAVFCSIESGCCIGSFDSQTNECLASNICETANSHSTFGVVFTNASVATDNVTNSPPITEATITGGSSPIEVTTIGGNSPIVEVTTDGGIPPTVGGNGNLLLDGACSDAANPNDIATICGSAVANNLYYYGTSCPDKYLHCDPYGGGLIQGCAVDLEWCQNLLTCVLIGTCPA